MSLDENAPRGKSAAPITPLAAPAPGVALWWCELDVATDVLDVLERTLSGDERARAARFGTAALRARYVAGRGTLRSVLGARLGTSPSAVPIVRGTRGRPCLGNGSDTGGRLPPLDFNISHTAGAAMIGVATCSRIGVDIERRDRAINTSGIARKFLSTAERDSLAALDADAARLRVLQIWTCKEAMSKATGDALSAPFAALSVDLANGPRLTSGPAPYIPTQWSLERAAAPEGFFATVALWSG